MAMSVVTAGLVACNKTEPDPAPTESFGSFDIEMEYAWGMDGEGFALSTPLAHPMTGDTLTFDTFKHYVGHVILEDVNGRIYTDAQAYALFDVADPGSPEMLCQRPRHPRGQKKWRRWLRRPSIPYWK